MASLLASHIKRVNCYLELSKIIQHSGTFLWISVALSFISLSFAPKSFAPLMLIVSLVPLLSVALSPKLTTLLNINLSSRDHPLFFRMFMVLFWWAILSVFWSQHPLQSASLLIKFLILSIATVVTLKFYNIFLPVRTINKIGLTITMVLVISSCYLIINQHTGFAIAKFSKVLFGSDPAKFNASFINNSTTSMALLMWISVLYLLQKRYNLFAFLVWLLCAITIFSHYRHSADGSATAMLQLVGATTIFAIMYVIMRFFPSKIDHLISFLQIFVAIGALAAMILFKIFSPLDISKLAPYMSGSAKHRLCIWEYSSNIMNDTNLFGIGFDGARYVGRDAKSKCLIYEENTGKSNSFKSHITLHGESIAMRNIMFMKHEIPLHTHNFIMQIGVELGYTGVLLVVLFFILMLQYIKDNYYGSVKMVSIALLFSAASMPLTAYGIWQMWMWGVFYFTLTLFVIISKLSLPVEGSNRFKDL